MTSSGTAVLTIARHSDPRESKEPHETNQEPAQHQSGSNRGGLEPDPPAEHEPTLRSVW